MIEPSKIVGKGCFVAVDSRPVSCAKGVLKQVLCLYKSYLRKATAGHSSINIKNPFLYMNIICQPGAYDPNVEPAKDDVLFTNPDKLLFEMERFFARRYSVDEEPDHQIQNAASSDSHEVDVSKLRFARRQTDLSLPLFTLQVRSGAATALQLATEPLENGTPRIWIEPSPVTSPGNLSDQGLLSQS